MSGQVWRWALLGVALGVGACVSGSKMMADSEVIASDVERARRSGAMQCAPRELASAEAHLEFGRGELSQGNSSRAAEHIRTAEAAVKKALGRSRDCANKQVLVKDAPPMVVRIESADSDGDGIPDKDDKCPNEPEDRDGFQDDDGCPDPDNDADGVLDANDRCPLDPGPASNFGCPAEAPKDSDGDGIPDNLDRCPYQAEDKDGFEDEDGCPDPDNDGDGLLDTADKCPNQAGPPTNFGCPVLDRDGDGILDKDDKCPDEPEDKDGFEDEDGCPDLDNDRDGIPDAQDKCPNEPEDKDGFEDEDGCPDPDNDKDGIPDLQDKCPNAAGPASNGGCPTFDKDGDGMPDNLDKCPD
jgi:OOP family OmpA-OmpF porin